MLEAGKLEGLEAQKILSFLASQLYSLPASCYDLFNKNPILDPRNGVEVGNLLI
jgi:hypothetical protein